MCCLSHANFVNCMFVQRCIFVLIPCGIIVPIQGFSDDRYKGVVIFRPLRYCAMVILYGSPFSIPYREFPEKEIESYAKLFNVQHRQEPVVSLGIGYSTLLQINLVCRPRGLTVKASDFGSEDWGFKSLRGRFFIFIFSLIAIHVS